MKLAYRIEKLEDVNEALRDLYKKTDGGFILDTDPSQSNEMKSLMASRDKILSEKKDEQKRREELESKKDDDHLEQLEKDKEYEKAIEIIREKGKNDLAAAQEKAESLRLQLRSSMLDTAVESMAAYLAGDKADLIKPHLKARMVVKEVEGDMKLFVTDVTGTPSALTSKQLMEEFKGNELYAPILQGRQSSGGGGNGDNGGGGVILDEAEKFFKPETKNLTEQAKLKASDPALYKKLSEKYAVNPMSYRGM